MQETDRTKKQNNIKYQIYSRIFQRVFLEYYVFYTLSVLSFLFLCKMSAARSTSGDHRTQIRRGWCIITDIVSNGQSRANSCVSDKVHENKDQHQLRSGPRRWSPPEIHEGLLTEWKGSTQISCGYSRLFYESRRRLWFNQQLSHNVNKTSSTVIIWSLLSMSVLQTVKSSSHCTLGNHWW